MCSFKTIVNTFKSKKGYTVTSVQTDFVGNQCITVYVNTNGNVLQYNLTKEGVVYWGSVLLTVFTM